MTEKMKKLFDDIIERRVIGKLATILVPVLLAIIAFLIAPYFTGEKDSSASAATLAQAKQYTDDKTEDLKSTVEWMAATMEVKWNVRRPRSRR